MAATNTEIVNLALAKLGSATISDWNEATKEGRTATAVFTNLREWLQERFPWNFCLERIVLSSGYGSTGSNYSNEYTYYWALSTLTDYLKVIEVVSNPLVKWLVENDNFYCSSNAVTVRYVKKISDPTLMPPAFVNAFALAIAMEIAPIVTGDINMRYAVKQEFELEIQNAYLLNAIEGRSRVGKGSQSLDLMSSSFQQEGRNG